MFSDAVRRDLIARHGEPHRHYHTLEHIQDCLDQVQASADLDDAQTEELLRLSGSIMSDRDYAYWVNSFIPDEDETAYWDDDHPRWKDVRLKACNNFIGHAYEKPNRLRAQVFTRVYFRYQEGRSMCKKFLIMLAAINHTLLCREGTSSAQESPSQTAARYAEERYFSLENEVR